MSLDSINKKIDSWKNIDIKDCLLKGSLLVEGTAKTKCPVDTGQLRNSITHNYFVTNNTMGYEIGTNYEYAPYVEYGTGLYAANDDGRKTPWSYQDSEGNWHTTKGQKPQPYLQPALNENRDRILDMFNKEIKRGKK